MVACMSTEPPLQLTPQEEADLIEAEARRHRNAGGSPRDVGKTRPYWLDMQARRGWPGQARP
jgi:hypothetical protein